MHDVCESSERNSSCRKGHGLSLIHVSDEFYAFVFAPPFVLFSSSLNTDAFSPSSYIPLVATRYTRFREKVFGRLVLLGALQATAVDQELINNQVNFPDKFVARAHIQSISQGQGSGGGTGGSGGGGSQSGGKVAKFYLQVLADSFAKDLPSARRGEEQLGALAGT